MAADQARRGQDAAGGTLRLDAVIHAVGLAFDDRVLAACTAGAIRTAGEVNADIAGSVRPQAEDNASSDVGPALSCQLLKSPTELIPGTATLLELPPRTAWTTVISPHPNPFHHILPNTRLDKTVLLKRLVLLFELLLGSPYDGLHDRVVCQRAVYRRD